MALPFAADACLVASSFEADADDADDAAELADDAAAVFEDSALVSDAFAFVSDVFAAEADLAAALACNGHCGGTGHRRSADTAEVFNGLLKTFYGHTSPFQRRRLTAGGTPRPSQR